MQKANSFGKGKSVYKCTCCNRMTRQVGTGDCENVEMCFDCYELSGIENGYNDGNLQILEYAADILRHYGSIVSKGGDAQSFDWIRNEAIDAVSAKTNQTNQGLRPPSTTQKERLKMKQTARYIPQGYELLAKDERFGFEVHGKAMANKSFAICFRGKAVKPAWHYSFRTEEALKKQIEETLRAEMDAAERKEKRKIEQKAANASHDAKPGDIFRSSWGYDQTNIDYYQIVAISGQMATLSRIGEMSEETGFMSGESVPCPDHFIGKQFRRRIQKMTIESEPFFRVNSCANAYRMKPLATVGNKPVFESSNWTAYA